MEAADREAAMILQREPSDWEKRHQLLNSGWSVYYDHLWSAPNCFGRMTLAAAWQQFKLGKRCEQPLVKIQEKT